MKENYDNSKMLLENVQTTKSEDPVYYFTRLINCYYKTTAVHKEKVHAVDNGNSVWEASIKYGTNPSENILLKKEKLMQIIKE